MVVQTMTQTQTQTLSKRSNVTSDNRQQSPDDSITHKRSNVKRVPAVKPPFTVGDVRRAIPAHCFQHSYIRSYAYLFGDIVLASVLLYLSTFIEAYFSYESPKSYLYHVSPFVSFIVCHTLWCLYWISQGIAFTGLWVIGHECGHGGFTASEVVNDITGYIVHSFLMVPYYSWKISHRRHHSNTGNIERDEVFVPEVDYDRYAPKHDHENYILLHDNDYWLNNQPTESDNYIYDFVSQIYAAIQRVFWMTVMLTLGWPAYLAANVSSNKSYPQDTWVSHFSPYSPLFQSSKFFGYEPPKQHKQVIASDIGLLITIGIMWKLSSIYGLSTIVYMYVLPIMQNIMWLVIITFLQHTDKQLPHYDSSEWDWLRGALATIDRDYGILNTFFHHIGDTHIVHHIFHTMPFYHAQEATEAVKPLLKQYYTFDNTPIFTALWKNYGECLTVSPDENHKGVYWWSD